MATTVSHPVPSVQAQAIADLTGYEDAATLRWQQACVQAANNLTALPNGRYVNVRMERMRQGLELAQRGAVTLPDDGQDLSAVVRSGSNLYQVDTRLLTCTCADYQKHLQACMTRLLPWRAEVRAACEANYEARKQAEDKAKAPPSMPPERPLDEQIAAAVQAAMRAQTAASREGARTPASSEEHATLTAAKHEKDPGWCPQHQVTMRWHDGNARGPGWFSHQLTDGSYCKGK